MYIVHLLCCVIFVCFFYQYCCVMCTCVCLYVCIFFIYVCMCVCVPVCTLITAFTPSLANIRLSLIVFQ